MNINYLLFSVVFIFFSFIVFRVKIKRDYKNIQRFSMFSTILAILVFAVHANSVYLILPTKWPYLPQMPENTVTVNIFRVMLGVGIIILLLSWLKLGAKVTIGIDKSKLQTKGMYKYSRNPQLVGYGFILASFTIIYFSYTMLFWFLNYLITAYFMVKSEEEFLYQKYKEEYKDYCRQVPRIIKL
ncbi:MAG: isoprenylcysteine carboxylmethyltransferase family protein [Bacteroidetes bacterium]|nr:isoprenylcysteine carboxylmethyltransferase family protein [Bacteroidota bacterium]